MSDTEELHERYAKAAAEWALMYPISSWGLREGEAAEGLAKIWGEQIARYLTKYVRDEELKRLRAERDTLKAEVERLLKFTATCTCGTPGLDYEGPQPDCTVHGAVRAYNEAQAAIERVRAKLAELRGGASLGVELDLLSPSDRTVVRHVTSVISAALAVPDAPGGES